MIYGLEKGNLCSGDLAKGLGGGEMSLALCETKELDAPVIDEEVYDEYFAESTTTTVTGGNDNSAKPGKKPTSQDATVS